MKLNDEATPYTADGTYNDIEAQKNCKFFSKLGQYALDEYKNNEVNTLKMLCIINTLIKSDSSTK